VGTAAVCWSIVSWDGDSPERWFTRLFTNSANCRFSESLSAANSLIFRRRLARLCLRKGAGEQNSHRLSFRTEKKIVIYPFENSLPNDGRAVCQS
jgi:hypothetical protein